MCKVSIKIHENYKHSLLTSLLFGQSRAGVVVVVVVVSDVGFICDRVYIDDNILNHLTVKLTTGFIGNSLSSMLFPLPLFLPMLHIPSLPFSLSQ